MSKLGVGERTMFGFPFRGGNKTATDQQGATLGIGRPGRGGHRPGRVVQV